MSEPGPPLVELDPSVEAGVPPEPRRELSRGVLGLWILGGLVSTLFAGVFAVMIVSVWSGAGDPPGWLAPALAVAALAYGVLAVGVLPVLRFRRWRFAVRAEEIDLLRGAVVRRRTIIPMARVQHVDSQQTPIGRMLDVASLTVHTAASAHTIPGLPVEFAYRLRTEIARRARVSDEV